YRKALKLTPSNSTAVDALKRAEERRDNEVARRQAHREPKWQSPKTERTNPGEGWIGKVLEMFALAAVTALSGAAIFYLYWRNRSTVARETEISARSFGIVRTVSLLTGLAFALGSVAYVWLGGIRAVTAVPSAALHIPLNAQGY